MLENKKKMIPIYKIGGIVLLLLSLFLIATTILNRIPAYQAIIYFVFQLLGVFLPGVAIMRAINIKQIDAVVFFCFSYALGYVFTIFEYLAIRLMNLTQYSLLIMCVFALAAVLFLWRKGISSIIHLTTEKKFAASFCVILGIVLVLIFLLSNLSNISPEFANNTNYFHLHPDILAWMQNASSLARSFPVEHPRITGVVFNYHYFASMHTALVHFITNASIFHSWIGLSSFTSAILLTGGVYCLMRSLTKSLNLFLFGCIMLLFTSGFENISALPYASTFYWIPNGFDLGMAFQFFYLALTVKAFKEAFHKKLAILLFIFMMALTGLRGPIALVSLMLMGCLSIGWLFKKNWKKAFLYGLPSLFAFLLICFLFVVNSKVSAGLGGLNIKGETLVKTFLYVAKYYKAMVAIGIPNLLAKGISILIWIPSIHPALLVLFLISIVTLIRHRKTIDQLDIACLVTFMICFIVAVIFAMPGGGQTYFLMAAIPILICFCIYVLSRFSFFESTNKKWQFIQWGIAGLGVLCYIFGAYIPIPVRIEETLSLVVQSYTGQSVQPKHKYLMSAGDILTAEDFKALEWLRVNSDADSIIIVDKGVINQSERYFDYSTFSEKRIYLDNPRYTLGMDDEVARRMDLIQRVYQGDEDALAQVQSEGVDYVICTKRLTEYRVPKTSGENVFENETILIYHLYK